MAIANEAIDPGCVTIKPRFLLDRLFTRDGRTLTELESELEMTARVRLSMKHLRVLEDANLVVTRRSGREKLHFLNPVPFG